MSNFAQFASGVISRSPATIVGRPTAAQACTSLSSYVLGTLSGAMTAATYKNVLSVTGAGVLNLAACSTVDATARDIAIKVTIDGTQVVELTAAGVATAGNGLIPVGWYIYDASGASTLTTDQIPFNSSLVIAIRSSLTETDKMNWFAFYRTV